MEAGHPVRSSLSALVPIAKEVAGNQQFSEANARIVEAAARTLQSPAILSRSSDSELSEAIELIEMLREGDGQKSFTKTLDGAAEALSAALSARGSKNVQVQRPSVPMAFISDLDNRDFNGSQLSSFQQCLEDGLIVVTTRSLASGSGIDDNKRFARRSTAARAKLCAARDDWKIFADGELLLFVPAALAKGKGALKLLGFDASRLVPLSVEEALSGPITESRPTVDNVCDLFLEESVERFLLVTGHGGPDTSVAGIKSESFNHFLDRLAKLEAGGLVVRSCYAGGRHRLRYLDNSDSGKLIHRPRLPFPVALQSAGEITTLFDKEWNPSLFLQDMMTFSKKNRRTKTCMDKILADRAQKKQWKLRNCIQITSGYHPGDAPGGFESLSLDEGEILLSHSNYLRRALEVFEQRPKGRISEEEPLSIGGASTLKVQSLDVRTPLIFDPPFPVFISTVPGTTHHFFKSVTIKGSLAEFRSKMATLYQGGKTGKVLVVDNLQAGIRSTPRRFCGVIIHLGNKSCLLREGAADKGRFYIKTTDKKRAQKISRERYLLEAFAVLRRSRPQDTSSRLAGPWGESPDLWKDKFAEVCETCRLSDNDPSLQAILQLSELMMLHARGQTLDADCQALEAALVTHVTDRSALLHTAAQLGLKSLALRVLEESSGEDLDLEQRGMLPDTVLLKATRRNWTEVVQLLLKRRAKVDIANEDSVTPLMLAAYNDNEVLVEALIKSGSSSIDKQDKDGETALMHAFGRGKGAAFALLLKAGANPLRSDFKGYTLASRMARSGNVTALSRLVNGVDSYLLNEGPISPLNAAIRHRKGKVVKALIDDLGADVNHEDGSISLPLVVALNHGSKEQLDQLLNAEKIDLDAGWYTTPLIAAVKLGVPETVRRLLEMGANPNIEVKGEHPLTAAAQRGDQVMATLLTQYGARV